MWPERKIKRQLCLAKCKAINQFHGIFLFTIFVLSFLNKKYSKKKLFVKLMYVIYVISQFFFCLALALLCRALVTYFIDRINFEFEYLPETKISGF